MLRGRGTVITYKKAGVDIDAGNALVEDIKRIAGRRAGIGGFGALYEPAFKKYKHPVLVSSTDGVGTKLKIAFLLNRHDTVGVDLVAMNVNDIVATGAEPLFFLDYIATGKISREKLTSVVRGIKRGCDEAGCVLIGGETAEMPGMYQGDEYDLAGFAVGIVDKGKMINPGRMKPGDAVVGLASSGLHSNGFSLVRKVFSKKELKKYSKELLKPTRIYVKPVLSLLKALDLVPTGTRSKALPAGTWSKAPRIKGIAHITGGAFYDKIGRIIPRGLGIVIRKQSWPVPRLFRLIQKKGRVPEHDLYRTLNMGIGMALVVAKKDVETVRRHMKKFHLRSWEIGRVIKGKGVSLQ